MASSSGCSLARQPSATPTPPGGLPPLPPTLDAAIDAFAGSPFTRDRLGADVVDHIANFCSKERDASRVAVTDWDRKRLLDI